MGLGPYWMVMFGGLMVDPAVAKFTPWLKFDPTESKNALRWGNLKVSASKQQEQEDAYTSVSGFAHVKLEKSPRI